MKLVEIENVWVNAEQVVLVRAPIPGEVDAQYATVVVLLTGVQMFIASPGEIARKLVSVG